MSEDDAKPSGPDLAAGVAIGTLESGRMLLGHVQGQPVLLVRVAEDLFAVDAVCTHYGGPLAEGLLVGHCVRCPWHHAEFDLRTGAVLRAPALDAIACWKVEQRDGIAYVREKLGATRPTPPGGAPEAIVIVGAGAAGNAAARMLRELGFAGSVTLLSADPALPYDRPNLSKGNLAGTGSYEVMPQRDEAWYREQRIDLRLATRATRIDTAACSVELDDGGRLHYDRLLLATGAEPVRLDLPGADRSLVHYLRTLADCDALVAAVGRASRAVVIGSSFIGLEAAASLRTRGLEVEVVGLDRVPMEKVLGTEVGSHVRKLHEQHGVVFHLGTSPVSIEDDGVVLRDGSRLEADLVLIGVGVRPDLALAQQAGLALDRGVQVDEYLETSTAGIYAAGDIVRWPDPLSGQRIRVEHWVVAERQGQTAARNMLGLRERYDAVPFFWTEQYDFGLAYIGHAEHWDRIEIDGRLEEHDCRIDYLKGSERQAVAVVHRDFEGLRAEAEFERLLKQREPNAASDASSTGASEPGAPGAMGATGSAGAAGAPGAPGAAR
jgi:NADPH-dependent 2,4-dienoyl-CoA reductase/sulfur reductase-like enzyme/nitrite reductase/ring-hydroxylating ferredoxin subunit